MTRDAEYRMIVFDDGRGKLGPMTDLRAAFEVRTGLTTTAGRLATARPRTLAGYWVPERLRPLVATRANAPVNRLPEDEVLYLANGRWARPDDRPTLGPGEAWVEPDTGDVVAAVLRRADAEYFLASGELPERVRTTTSDERRLYRHPWDVLSGLRDTLVHDIMQVQVTDAHLPERVATVRGDHAIEIHASARIGANVVLDAEAGPILIEEDAVVRHGAVLLGPCAVGRGSSVLEQSLIKGGTSIGPRCKVAGEVGGTILQGMANKAHDGHLGDSWVGAWANLGAGTCVSNLLNTYGDVTVTTEPGGQRRRTGLTFCGAFVGDHAKTAIGTRIMTGSVLGTGAMIAATAPPPSTVRRFAWLTDAGERTFRLEKLLEVMRTVMARRERTMAAEYEQLVRTLHAEHADGGGAA